MVGLIGALEGALTKTLLGVSPRPWAHDAELNIAGQDEERQRIYGFPALLPYWAGSLNGRSDCRRRRF